MAVFCRVDCSRRGDGMVESARAAGFRQKCDRRQLSEIRRDAVCAPAIFNADSPAECTFGAPGNHDTGPTALSDISGTAANTKGRAQNRRLTTNTFPAAHSRQRLRTEAKACAYIHPAECSVRLEFQVPYRKSINLASVGGPDQVVTISTEETEYVWIAFYAADNRIKAGTRYAKRLGFGNDAMTPVRHVGGGTLFFVNSPRSGPGKRLMAFEPDR